jgi:hypothetical protein
MTTLLRAELRELTLVKAAADLLAAEGRAAEGLALLQQGLRNAVELRESPHLEGANLVAAWREAAEHFAQTHGVRPDP